MSRERYTFAVQWPEPFPQQWVRSRRSWPSWRLAAEEMVEFLHISAESGTDMAGKVIKVTE